MTLGAGKLKRRPTLRPWPHAAPETGKEPLVLPLDHHQSYDGQGWCDGCCVLLTIYGYCGPDRVRGCSVGLFGIGKCGSNLILCGYKPPWGYSKQSVGAGLCGGNSQGTRLEPEPLEPTLVYNISQEETDSRCGWNGYLDRLGSHKTAWERRCQVKLPELGNYKPDCDRGCRVDFSRSSKYGIFQVCCSLKGPLFETAVPL
ncbi:hypothetical protein V6N13_114306 [Hibiscus sabdariffa]